MTRSLKILALAAVTLGGAFLTTAAQASAANFNVSFAIYNADTNSKSMIRQTNPLPTGVSGLIAPPSAISPASYDPASGFGTFTGRLPTPSTPVSVQLQYSRDTDSSDECTFSITVSNVGGLTPYLLHFTSDHSRCTVPGDVYSATGQFTTTTYLMNWAG